MLSDRGHAKNVRVLDLFRRLTVFELLTPEFAPSRIFFEASTRACFGQGDIGVRQELVRRT